MNVKLITFANYSGNAKSSDTSKGLKYGDLEIRLINDKYYFVHKNGAIIDNIQAILMKSGAFKGLMSTMPTSITDAVHEAVLPEELNHYAPTMTLLNNLVLDFVKRNELQDGTFEANIKSLLTPALTVGNESSNSIKLLPHHYESVIDTKTTHFDITNKRTNKADYVFFDYKEPNRNNYSCIMRFGQKSGNQGQLTYDNGLNRLELGTSSNKNVLILFNDKHSTFDGDVTMPSITLNNQNITKVSISTNYDFDNFSDNEMLTALCIKNLFNTRPPIEHTHTLSEITDYEPPDLSPYAKQTDIEPLYDDIEELATNKANIVHNHLSEDITDMKETIETTNYSTLTVGTLTNTTINTETVNAGVININNQSLDEVLDTKADVGHKHTTEDITNIKDYVNSLINDKQQSIIDEAFKAIYPIGSIYISHVNPLFDGKWKKHKGTEQHIQYEWHGCIWEYIDDYVFLRNSGRYQNALIWYEDYRDYGKRGGSDSHSHTTGDYRLEVGDLPTHSHEQYILTNGGGGGVTGRADWSNDTNDGRYLTQMIRTGMTGDNKSHNHGDTGEASNLPPYLNVYMYKRIE